MVCVWVRWADRTRTRLTVDCRPPAWSGAPICRTLLSHLFSAIPGAFVIVEPYHNFLDPSKKKSTDRRWACYCAGVLCTGIVYCVLCAVGWDMPCPEPFLMVQVESVPARVATRWAQLSQPHVALVCAQGLASFSFPPECKATAQLELPFAVVYGTARACERAVEEGETSISPTCAPTLHTSSTSQQRGGDANNGISVGLLIRNKPSKAAGAPVGLFVYVSRFAVEHS